MISASSGQPRTFAKELHRGSIKKQGFLWSVLDTEVATNTLFDRQGNQATIRTPFCDLQSLSRKIDSWHGNKLIPHE